MTFADWARYAATRYGGNGQTTVFDGSNFFKSEFVLKVAEELDRKAFFVANGMEEFTECEKFVALIFQHSLGIEPSKSHGQDLQG